MTRTALTGLSALVLAAPAQAAGPAAATITSCKFDSLTVAGKLALTGSAARKVRGANLQLRLQALPLFGLPRAVAWRDLGKKTRGSGRQVFAGLPADNWAGVLSWRFRKGRKTVLSGDERSQPVKVGATKGKANCTLSEGAKPVDTTPPALYIVPAGEGWHRAPAPVQLLAQDDFSGVKSMRYSLDGGPLTEIRNGATFDIPGEGAHQVQWAATDVAGNTGSRTVTVNVDAGPPTKPKLSRPFSVTASTTPSFQWSASTDSGSGLKGYLLAIKRGDGSLAALQPVDPGLTSANSPTALNDGETYTATITAVDRTDVAWTIDSDPVTFKVDTHAEVVSSNPADGSVRAYSQKSAPLTITLDRPATGASVGASTKATGAGVQLQRDSGSTGDYPISCSTPCSTITVTPPGDLPEGRYTLSVNVKSEEGTAIAKDIKFAVPDPMNEFGSFSTSTSCGSLLPLPTKPANVTTQSGQETVLLSFSYSLASGSGRVRFFEGSNNERVATLAAGSGSQTLPLTIASAGPHPLTIEYCVLSGSGTLALSNVWVSRAP